jgi:hypothetical protein
VHQAKISTDIATQIPAFCMMFSPWILFMTIQNHTLDASIAIGVVQKQWFGRFVSWTLLEDAPKIICIKPNFHLKSKQKP